MELLWKLEHDFKDELERRTNIVKHCNITVKELLDLGFNNNYLILSNDKKICLGWKDLDGSYSYEYNEEQLNVKVYMKEDYGVIKYDEEMFYGDYYEDTDSDGYHIAKVYCVNNEDEKLFKEV